MRSPMNIILAIAVPVIIYITDGWWQLLGFLPVILLAGVDPTKKSKKEVNPTISDSGDYAYNVYTYEGETTMVECRCPVQFDGGWAHFANEITEFGFYPRGTIRSFYKPRGVELINPQNVDEMH